DSCDGSMAFAKENGGKELKRESVSLGDYPGKQLIVKIPSQSAKFIQRVYYAHGRAFIVMIGGRGLEPDHPNVKMLFDSFEILDPGPEAAPKTEPKPAPQSQP